jgi:dihydroneopterin aldolase
VALTANRGFGLARRAAAAVMCTRDSVSRRVIRPGVFYPQPSQPLSHPFPRTGFPTVWRDIMADAPDAPDVVSLASLSFTAVVGLDLWARADVPQPCELSLDFLLAPGSLLLAAAADEVRFSVVPWDVVHGVQAAVAAGAPFASGRALLEHIVRAVAQGAGGACEELRARLEMRRALGCLRAEDGVLWEARWRRGVDGGVDGGAGGALRVSHTARGLLLSVTLGITEHERSMKQNIALDVCIEEESAGAEDVPYALLVENIIQVRAAWSRFSRVRADLILLVARRGLCVSLARASRARSDARRCSRQRARPPGDCPRAQAQGPYQRRLLRGGDHAHARRVR